MAQGYPAGRRRAQWFGGRVLHQEYLGLYPGLITSDLYDLGHVTSLGLSQLLHLEMGRMTGTTTGLLGRLKIS